MGEIAYVNPVGERLKKTKKLKRRKAKNPAALLALSNGRGKPAKTLIKRSSTMARKKSAKRVKRANPKRRKRRNALPSTSVGIIGKKKYGNPSKMRKRRNPAGSGPGDLFTMLGVTAAAFIGTKIASNFLSKQVEGMLPEGIKPYTKPLISTSVPVLVYFFGDKLIKNATIKNSIIVGSGLAAVHDLSKAFMPQFAMDYLSDIMGEEVTMISDDAYAKALEYAAGKTDVIDEADMIEGADVVTVDGNGDDDDMDGDDDDMDGDEEEDY